MSTELIPELRFEGFNGSWKHTHIGDVSTIGNGRDYKHLKPGPIPVYGTGGYMCSVNSALSFERDAIGIGRKGTIDHPYILKAPFWTVDTLFFAIPKTNLGINFLQCCFDLVNWKELDESTGLPSLSKRAIASAGITLPAPFAEQRAIGAFFAKLDELIAQHRVKRETLQRTKTALLQKMFPRKGADAPELRFPGFDGPWHTVKLEDICDLVIGRTPSRDNPSLWGGTLPWVSISDMRHGSTVTETTEHITPSGAVGGRLIPTGTILLSFKLTLGRLSFAGVDLYTNEAIAALPIKNQSKLDSTYLLHHLSSFDFYAGRNRATKGVTLNQQSLQDIPIYFPKALAEQRAIGTFFAKLDELISAEQTYVDKLQQTKVALLQKMFPRPGGAR
ncbi:restriction endonuclease subunit S [Nanchangia anserum]|uniref:Restriction endonuclease subunit S n=1 Tax=Nanchangia anserum TaxID=2692125 RepID=A0A8I0G952_9ACTO|nr:restriction endonuclease subunit S [Nanchangia anserum]MBD3690182.1 restriction endonuclease subunit S [Nanchangia anserum]QOX82363.1 restriction endonuclease subunit S [Nanchangia anserum]